MSSIPAASWTSPKHTIAVRDFPALCSKEEISRFLCPLNFFWSFLLNTGVIQAAAFTASIERHVSLTYVLYRLTQAAAFSAFVFDRQTCVGYLVTQATFISTSFHELAARLMSATWWFNLLASIHKLYCFLSSALLPVLSKFLLENMYIGFPKLLLPTLAIVTSFCSTCISIHDTIIHNVSKQPFQDTFFTLNLHYTSL